MSSIYPTWWDSTITLYNKYVNATTQQIVWERKVLKNCFWKINTSANWDKLYQVNSNTVICRIPKSDKFKSAYYWKQLSDSERVKYFTLQTGDVLINAEVDDEIDEYTKGKRMTDVLDKYKDFGTIKVETFSDNSDEARNMPHYVVSQG